MFGGLRNAAVKENDIFAREEEMSDGVDREFVVVPSRRVPQSIGNNQDIEVGDVRPSTHDRSSF